MLHRIIHLLISHIIPHEGNDFAPRLLRRGAMVMMFGLVVLSFVMANMQTLLWQSSDWLVGAILPAVVVDLTNEQRAVNAAPALTRSAILDAAAALKAADMAKNSYFSHDSPTGVTPWHWFSEAGYPFVHAGENLAVYFTDSNEVVDAWMASPGHRANIVNADYREIGIGTARGKYNGFDTIFVVQLFGTPAIATPVVAPKVAQSPQTLPPPTPAPVLAVAEVQPVVTTPVSEAIPVVPARTALTPQVAGESTEVAVEPEVAPVVTETVPVQTAVDVPLPPVVQEPLPERVLVTEVEDTYVSLYSDLAASSTNLTPARILTADTAGHTTPFVARMAVAPSLALQFLYLIIGSLTVLVLLTSVLLEWRQHRPREMVYGLSLLVVMCGLFYIHTMLTVGVVIG